MSYKIDTMAVHAGRGEFARLGVHAPPIDLSTTYPVADAAEASSSLLEMAQGGQPSGNWVYARLYNPTVARFEEGLANLESTDEAVAFSSGMAALTACLLAARGRRNADHVVAVRPIYGTSDHLLSSDLLGMKVTWAAADAIGAAIDEITPDRVALVVIETPSNPTLDLIDIRRVVDQAGDVPVLVDSTFATPILQNPAKLGATFVLHSATKFLGGYGDVIAGVVATNADWARELRHVRVATGALLHPLAAYLLHRGLTTLPVRIRAAQENAKLLAERLDQHPAVGHVSYPGLREGEDKGLIGTQMEGPGCMIAFEVQGGQDAAIQVLNHLQVITHAVSLGSVDTLIQHPVSLTHKVVPKEVLDACGISEGLLRLSVGLEDVEDLWEDLSSALNQVMPALLQKSA